MQATRTRCAGLVARTRPLPARKQLLFAEHQHLLTSNDLVLFLRPGDFSAEEWRTLRSSLASTSSAAGPAAQPQHAIKLTLLRPGLLPALLRDHTASSSTRKPRIDLTHLSQSSHLSGPLAVVTSPSLSPPVLNKVLSLVSKFSKTPAPNSPPPAANAPPLERLELLSSLLERTTAATKERTAQVGKLPPLDVLRAQIVGLLAMPASRIVGVVGASGRQVGRTVEGFKAGLEEQANPAQP
ncbi:uncharacterized protein JCM15063_002568 [Sporobolomyces koalae]|uniref:uncharacterized protein n=1 Tax=Sporobolomyces koalae TaxID=500713 RepID=UPI003180CD62